MKVGKKILVICFCILLLCGNTVMAASGTRFEDVSKDSWYYEAVETVSALGFFKGTSDKEFSPGLYMTRGMFVTVLGRYSEYGYDRLSDVGNFTDINGDEYYATYAAWAYINKIANGTGGGKFSPELNIKREDMVKMLYAYADLTGMDLSYNDLAYTSFSDTDKVSDYAVTPMKWAVTKGLINGYDGKIDPAGLVTRAQAAQLFLNLHNIIQDDPLFELDIKNISEVAVRNGNTGDTIKVEDKEQIESIINTLNGFKYTTLEKNRYDGWTIGVIISQYGQSEPLRVYFRNDSLLDYNGYAYRASQDNYFKALFTDILSYWSTP